VAAWHCALDATEEIAMSQRFAESVVLVAGGTGALGRAVSQAFFEEGGTVIVTYRSQQEFDALRAAAPADGRLEGHRVDVADETAVQALIDGVVARHGRLDALVNTVGGYAGGARLWEVDASTLDRMMALNLRSGYVLARAAVPAMLKRGAGVIVNIASKAAVEHAGGAAAYAASKAAALALMDSLAAELAGTGVRANTVLPSIIDSAANRAAMPAADFAKWPKADEIARVILFLCSTDANVIHGAAIPVYGNS
jgi:NAD(P)-dependent dehydrogenase (short-subunit alcohol dehydrogenase family)